MTQRKVIVVSILSLLEASKQESKIEERIKELGEGWFPVFVGPMIGTSALAIIVEKQ